MPTLVGTGKTRATWVGYPLVMDNIRISGRMAAIPQWSGTQALAPAKGPVSDSVSVIGKAGEDSFRMVDVDGQENLRIRMAAADSGGTTITISNPGATESAEVSLTFPVSVPISEEYAGDGLSEAIGSGVKQVTVSQSPFDEGGFTLQIDQGGTADWYFSSAGVEEPFIGMPATTNIPEQWGEIARAALR